MKVIKMTVEVSDELMDKLLEDETPLTDRMTQALTELEEEYGDSHDPSYRVQFKRLEPWMYR